jgi:hypothetical protein
MSILISGKKLRKNFGRDNGRHACCASGVHRSADISDLTPVFVLKTGRRRTRNGYLAGRYATDVDSLSGDGWANYDMGLDNAVLFSDHLEYLGLTSQEIGTAGAPVLDGVGPLATEYFTIQDSMVNSLEALLTQLQIADSVLF